MIKTYKTKTLIPGYKIKQSFSKFYVAVPEKYSNRIIKVVHDNKFMFIQDYMKEAVHFEEFKDKFFSTKTYKLGYFLWEPHEIKQMELL